MEMRRARTLLNGMVILSEVSHVFCCVLPTVFSILGVLIGLGVAGAMPFWLSGLHELIHEWELPVIGASAAVLVIGWALYYVSERMDCHDHGCHHPPCGPQKKNSALVLKIATMLFMVNVLVFLIFHRGLDRMGFTHAEQAAQPATHADEEHNHAH